RRCRDHPHPHSFPTRRSSDLPPDDYLGHLEHPDEAAKRIATTQAGLASVVPKLSHIESFGDGAWHLIFHHRADLKAAPHVAPGPNVAALEWFPRSRLPDRSTMAHDGWAADVLDAMDRRGSD